MSKKEGLEPVYTIESPQTSTADITDAGANGNETKQIKYISSATVTADHKKNGYRLPTGAEWEYAARGGDPSAAAWDYTFSGADTASGTSYSSSSNAGLDAVGWYCYNNDTGTTGSSDVTNSANGKGTHQVGQKAPNALGIYDMSGNVWEWCYDRYSSITSSTADTGSSSGSNRVGRGGSWSYYADLASVCCRSSGNPGYRYGNLGFRLVRSAQ